MSTILALLDKLTIDKDFLKHQGICGEKLDIWEHDAGYIHFNCQKCRLKGWLHMVRWFHNEPPKQTMLPDVEIVWGYFD